MVTSSGYFLVMQTDGNLVVYTSANKAVWNSGTEGTGSANYVIMQGDGNFVVYTSANKAVWNSGTNGTGALDAALTPSGIITLTTVTGHVVWES